MREKKTIICTSIIMCSFTVYSNNNNYSTVKSRNYEYRQVA